MPLTREQIVDQSHWYKDAGHLNGGTKFFGYWDVCVEFPRLVRMVKYFKATRDYEITWQVDFDGTSIELTDFDTVLKRLAEPPVLSEIEQQILDELTMGKFDPEKYARSVLSMLAHKGQVEYDRAAKTWRLNKHRYNGWRNIDGQQS